MPKRSEASNRGRLRYRETTGVVRRICWSGGGGSGKQVAPWQTSGAPACVKGGKESFEGGISKGKTREEHGGIKRRIKKKKDATKTADATPHERNSGRQRNYYFLAAAVNLPVGGLSYRGVLACEIMVQLRKEFSIGVLTFILYIRKLTSA
ncbi:hypothetical protein E2C01_035093 [Portunus trituberculatus]|uniref:Uncharacterized protein n=1 Tax=Portunus trituberculatus TaxID=210409 RepID=A0A5B7F298_PORTR|nr:hypothetical protein [Portunus trituberculatus]